MPKEKDNEYANASQTTLDALYLTVIERYKDYTVYKLTNAGLYTNDGF